MLHEIGVELHTALAAKGAGGFPVIDGPERRETTTFARERIVIEHDEQGADSFNAPIKSNPNPEMSWDRIIACKLTIYVKEPAKSATEWEHRRRANKLLDLVLVAMRAIAVGRKNFFSPRSGKFLLPTDLKQGETPGGAVYELKFTFSRGIADHKWDGTPAQKEVTITGDNTGVSIVNTDVVHGSGLTETA